MARSIYHRPAYKFFLTQTQDAASTVPRSWALTSLKSAQALLTTSNGVNQMTATLYDAGGYLSRVVRPHAMNVVQLWSNNWLGQWGPCWTGFVDKAHRILDPEQGDLIQLDCTGPIKLWEVTRQTPSDVASLAFAYTQNVAASTVLQYSAQAVRYPASGLVIDASADAGSGYQTAAGSSFINPDQQTWSAVISQLQASSAVEWFFDEQGFCRWRPVGYLGAPGVGGGPPLAPRTILAEEVLHADLAEGDAGVVTTIEVRYLTQPTAYVAAFWQAPDAMATHLGQRYLTVYAPWIISGGAARYLANTLGQMYSANVLTGTIIMPADPTFQVGSLVNVPALRGGNGPTTYYIASVQYTLDWGGQWLMILGLTYGRSPDQSFPYVGTIPYPVTTAQDIRGAASFQTTITPIHLDTTHPNRVLDQFTIVNNTGLANNTVVADPAILAPGSLVQVRTGVGSGKWIGPFGTYTVTAGKTGSGFVLQMNLENVTQYKTGYVTVVRQAGAPASTTTGPTPPPIQQVSTFRATNPGTGNGKASTKPPPDLSQPNSFALKALALAQTKADNPGGPYHYNSPDAGADGRWDCSGLVAWVFNQLGYGGFLAGVNGDVGPQGEYYQLLRKGARAIDVSQAQVGDLLFVQIPSNAWPHLDSWVAAQNGFAHVGWCSTPGGFNGGVTFGANDYAQGIGHIDINVFRSLGYPFNLALSMAGVTLASLLNNP